MCGGQLKVENERKRQGEKKKMRQGENETDLSQILNFSVSKILNI